MRRRVDEVLGVVVVFRNVEKCHLQRVSKEVSKTGFSILQPDLTTANN